MIAVYLFGSYAEGKERPLSDIDIGILLDRTDHNTIKEIRNKCIVELSRILRKDIHLDIPYDVFRGLKQREDLEPFVV